MRLARLRPIAIATVAGLLVGRLSGVIGVDGGELRLPILIAFLGFAAKVAAPINLIVTIITIAGAKILLYRNTEEAVCQPTAEDEAKAISQPIEKIGGPVRVKLGTGLSRSQLRLAARPKRHKRNSSGPILLRTSDNVTARSSPRGGDVQ
jgi:hypothetical protein